MGTPGGLAAGTARRPRAEYVCGRVVCALSRCTAPRGRGRPLGLDRPHHTRVYTQKSTNPLVYLEGGALIKMSSANPASCSLPASWMPLLLTAVKI